MSYKCLAFAGQEDFLSNIVHLSNVGSMLGQRRRRWPNIKTALDQCLVWVVSCNQFSGYINAVNLYSIGYCWPTLDRPRLARFEVEWFFNILKGLAHAKIIKKSVILFWLFNMTISCKHVHRLELQKFFNFSAAHSPVRLDIADEIPVFLIFDMVVNN